MPIVCSNCGREHENVKGRCPHCAAPMRLSKRQKERPAEMLGSTFECPKCGGEVTFVRVIRENKQLDVPVHVSSKTFACPN